MKKLTILLITIFIIYLIYSLMYINKANYVSISDNYLVNYNLYLKKELLNKSNVFVIPSVLNVYSDIKNNRTIRIDNNDYYLKKVLRESDILVISVGMNEFNNNFNKYNMISNYKCFNNMLTDIERMINEIKKYALGKIIFIGYYNPTNYYDANIDKLFYEIDYKLEKIMNNNKVVYISLYELIKGNNLKEDDFNLNNDGYKRIANMVNYHLD